MSEDIVTPFLAGSILREAMLLTNTSAVSLVARSGIQEQLLLDYFYARKQPSLVELNHLLSFMGKRLNLSLDDTDPFENKQTQHFRQAKAAQWLMQTTAGLSEDLLETAMEHELQS